MSASDSKSKPVADAIPEKDSKEVKPITVAYRPEHVRVAELLAMRDEEVLGKTFTVKGHVRSARMLFVELYDGSSPHTLQLVLTKPQKEAIKTRYGTSSLPPSTTISARVVIKLSEGKGQRYDCHVVDETFEVLGKVVDAATFLPALRGVSLDKWRAHTDLRAHSAVQAAIFRIRSHLSHLTHQFMHEKRIWHLDPNEITKSDCEGAGEMFIVTTFGEPGNPIPTKKPTATSDTKATNDKGEVDWARDHFENDDPGRLTVSSQLGLEYLVPGMGAVYTTNKSFRAERSQTTRHLAEFTHIEAELPFVSFSELLDFEEEYVVRCFHGVLQGCAQDLELLEKQYAPGIREKLRGFVAASPWPRLTYEECLKTLEARREDVLRRSPELKQIPKFGEDLGSVCERFLSEVVHKSPIFVINMPRQLKSFYMKRNADSTTVQGGDLLVPGLGELIGGSIRENDYAKLVRVMVERKMYKPKDKSTVDESVHDVLLMKVVTAASDSELDAALKSVHFGPLEPYVGLRRNASTPTGGFGLGFERLVTICTSSGAGANIRESVPFPVAFRELHL